MHELLVMETREAPGMPSAVALQKTLPEPVQIYPVTSCSFDKLGSNLTRVGVFAGNKRYDLLYQDFS